jgi:hypothetical protein
VMPFYGSGDWSSIDPSYNLRIDLANSQTTGFACSKLRSFTDRDTGSSPDSPGAHFIVAFSRKGRITITGQPPPENRTAARRS